MTRTPLINLASLRGRSMLMVHKMQCFQSAIATKGANDIHRDNRALTWQFQWRIYKKRIPVTLLKQFLGSFASKIDKCFNNILEMFWLCKIHYTKMWMWKIYHNLTSIFYFIKCLASLCSFVYDLLLWKNIWSQQRLIWQETKL